MLALEGATTGALGAAIGLATGCAISLVLIHVVNREFGTTVVLVTHDPEVAAQMPRSITIRNGRIGSEGRRGFDFGVVDEDGAVHIPDDLATRFPAGTLVQFEDTPEGVLLRAVDEQGDRS